jgi:hypothetical protein
LIYISPMNSRMSKIMVHVHSFASGLTGTSRLLRTLGGVASVLTAAAKGFFDTPAQWFYYSLGAWASGQMIQSVSRFFSGSSSEGYRELRFRSSLAGVAVAAYGVWTGANLVGAGVSPSSPQSSSVAAVQSTSGAAIPVLNHPEFPASAAVQQSPRAIVPTIMPHDPLFVCPRLSKSWVRAGGQVNTEAVICGLETSTNRAFGFER